MMMQPDDLKAIRKALDMTQAEFGEAMGVSRKLINDLEAGRVPVDKRTELAAKYLGSVFEIVPRNLKPGKRFVLIEKRYTGLNAPTSKHELSVHDTIEDAEAALQARVSDR